MHFTTAEITAWIGSYLWPLFRIAAMVMVAPVTGAQSVPGRIRLLIALAITAVVAPVVPQHPPVDPFTWSALLVIVQQILIGVAIGFAMQLVFGVVITGGQIVATQMGLSFASMVDPQNGINVPVLSQFYLLMTTLLYLVFDSHLVLIQMLVDSFRVLPIGPDGLTREGFWAIAGWGTQVFAGAVWLSLPAVMSLLVVNIAFGVMSRAAPQLHIFSIGFPITVLMGYLVLLFVLPSVVSQFSSVTADGFDLVRRLLGGG